MRVVVIGGCGFLGTTITRDLVNRGVEVVSVHRSVRHPARAGVRCVSLDYREVDHLKDELINATALIHLGSGSVPRTSVDLGVSGILAEVDANARLFEAASRLGIERVVYASSGGSVYGEVSTGQPITEETPTHPISPHGLLKVMTELALAHVVRVGSMTGTSLRPGNIYGPGQRQKRAFGVIPTFMDNLRNSKPSEIWGAEVVRDYVYVDDASRAFVEATLHSEPMPPVINIGTERGHTALEVYAMLQEILEVSAPISVTARPPTDPRWNVLDTTRWRGSLGASSKVDIFEGLIRTAQDAGHID